MTRSLPSSSKSAYWHRLGDVCTSTAKGWSDIDVRRRLAEFAQACHRYGALLDKIDAADRQGTYGWKVMD